MLALESNSAHRRLEQCSRTHSHAYHLWLLSPGHTGPSVTHTVWAAKSKIFTLWPLKSLPVPTLQ